MPRKTPAGCGCGAAGRATSMRPRLDAAENVPWLGHFHYTYDHFNEAAARCRGKRSFYGFRDHYARTTSMRPRLDAAENLPAPCFLIPA